MVTSNKEIKSLLPLRHYVTVMTNKYEVSFHHNIHYAMMHPKKMNFWFQLRNNSSYVLYVGDHGKKIFFAFQYYFHYTVIFKKE